MKRCSCSKFNQSIKFFLFLVIVPLLTFANQGDSSTVRLKNGARIKGEITQRTQNSITIKNQMIGEKEINWEDITIISSSEVYDSLQENRSIIVLPPPKGKRNFLLDKLSAEFLAGKIFSYDRFIGFGVRANMIFFDLLTLGGIAILHLGADSNSLPDGYGPLFYWGPELGFRISAEYFIFEPSVCIGEGSYQTGNNTGSQQASENNLATESDFFFAPGACVKINFGIMKLGLQYKYIIINDQKMSGLYISFGN